MDSPTLTGLMRVSSSCSPMSGRKATQHAVQIPRSSSGSPVLLSRSRRSESPNRDHCSIRPPKIMTGSMNHEFNNRTGLMRVSSSEAVEFATLEWVDWFNNRRLLEPIGNIPPAEAEARYYEQLNEPAMVACVKQNGLRDSRRGSWYRPGRVLRKARPGRYRCAARRNSPHSAAYEHPADPWKHRYQQTPPPPQ